MAEIETARFKCDAISEQAKRYKDLCLRLSDGLMRKTGELKDVITRFDTDYDAFDVEAKGKTAMTDSSRPWQWHRQHKASWKC